MPPDNRRYEKKRQWRCWPYITHKKWREFAPSTFNSICYSHRQLESGLERITASWVSSWMPFPCAHVYVARVLSAINAYGATTLALSSHPRASLHSSSVSPPAMVDSQCLASIQTLVSWCVSTARDKQWWLQMCSKVFLVALQSLADNRLRPHYLYKRRACILTICLFCIKTQNQNKPPHSEMRLTIVVRVFSRQASFLRTSLFRLWTVKVATDVCKRNTTLSQLGKTVYGAEREKEVRVWLPLCSQNCTTR